MFLLVFLFVELRLLTPRFALAFLCRFFDLGCLCVVVVIRITSDYTCLQRVLVLVEESIGVEVDNTFFCTLGTIAEVLPPTVTCMIFSPFGRTFASSPFLPLFHLEKENQH